MKQALSQRASVTLQEVLAILSSSASASPPPPCQCIPPHRGNALRQPQVPSAQLGALRSQGPTPALISQFPVILAPSLQMAFVWDLQGATVLGPSPRVKSRLRFSKSYRYCSLLFVAGRTFFFFSSASIALFTIQISFGSALISSAYNVCSNEQYKKYEPRRHEP